MDEDGAELELTQRDTDLFSQLTLEEIKTITTSVMEEMVEGLQVSLSRFRSVFFLRTYRGISFIYASSVLFGKWSKWKYLFFAV